ncbi:hypothetical protein D3C72_2103910 [compost metagenome]
MIEQSPAGVGTPRNQRIDVIVGRQAEGTDAQQPVGMSKPLEMIGAHALADSPILAIERQAAALPEVGRIEIAQQHHVGIDGKHRCLADMP